MKTLSIAAAVEAGFKTHRYGSGSYVAVALPREFRNQDFQSVTAEQFDPEFEVPGAEEGYFTQVVEDARGQFGLRGTLYVVRAEYTHNDGIQDWDVYGAVKVG